MATIAAAPAEATIQSGVVEKLVSITLSESDYQAIQNTKQNLAAVAQYLVEQFARGGAMVPAEQITYLSDLTRIPIYGADDLVGIVESVTRRNSPDGNLRIVTDVDPAFASGLEELAYAQGRTVPEILHETVNIVLTNSWLYSLSVDGGTIPLSADQRTRMETIIGRAPLTSEVLVNWIEEASDARRPKTLPEPSPVIQVSERKMSKLQRKISDKLEGITQ